jgi:hypothetical protein
VTASVRSNVDGARPAGARVGVLTPVGAGEVVRNSDLSNRARDDELGASCSRSSSLLRHSFAQLLRELRLMKTAAA